MSSSEQKVLQYLNEAHASEAALVRVLQSQIAMTPKGRFRTGLETHLDETRDHAVRLQARIGQLREGFRPLQAVVGLAETITGQALALAKTPADLVRGSGGEEKVLKNAKDAAATEALEIATYTALEQLAVEVGDGETAELAASIRADEEQMLARILREIPTLTRAVVRAEVDGKPSYEIAKTGAGEAVTAVAEGTKQAAESAVSDVRSGAKGAASGARSGATSAAKSTKRSAAKTSARGKRTARQARQVPGVARAEGVAKGAVAAAGDLPIARYDRLTAEDVTAKLPGLSQIDLAKVDAYERRNEDRSTITARIATLRADEPWPGYDEQTAAEIIAALKTAGARRTRAARDYERAHKNRIGVLSAAEKRLANA